MIWLWRSRQEHINPDQLLLYSLEELQEITAELQQDAADDEITDDVSNKPRDRRTRARVGPLPAHLPREIVRHELTESERACPCCGELRQEIGVESSEQLELIPAKLKVIQHDRVKYACRGCRNTWRSLIDRRSPSRKAATGGLYWRHRKDGERLPAIGTLPEINPDRGQGRACVLIRC